ncbi:hypothetical protein NP234_24065 [Salmonella enterica]|nr:hypothetical protein [Salmonella enterica]
MENEQILSVVAVIAAVALLGRVIISRQQRGGVNWLKVSSIVALAALFVGVLLSVDSYRLATWLAGPVDETDDLRADHVVGRQAGPAVMVADGVASGLPLYFALDADSASHTGYWQIKDGAADDATQREVLTSQSDSTRTAIKRTTSTFSIMRHPADPARYVGIYRLALTNGEKALAVMTDYDAARPGITPVMTSHPLAGKMADIAARDSSLNQMVYLSAFDSPFYADSTERRLLYAALAALAATIAAAAIGRASYKAIVKSKKHTK